MVLWGHGRNRRAYRRRGRHRAASSIQRAWRAKKRRKAGLNQRTMLSNRRAIKKLSKSLETKMVDNNQAASAVQFSGQYNDNIMVDNTGQESVAGIPFAADLLHLPQGAGEKQRVGAWIQLKSMTIHYCVALPTTRGTQDCWYEVFVVLDKSPTLGASLVGAQGLLALESAAPAPTNKLMLAFQNLDETGKAGRFKILARRKHRLCSGTIVGAGVVPAITPAPPPATFGSARAAYSNGVVQSLPKGFPQYINSSINLKLGHKINYGPDTSVQPVNQTIRLFAFQCNPAGYVQPQATLQFYTRVRYKDA